MHNILVTYTERFNHFSITYTNECLACCQRSQRMPNDSLTQGSGTFLTQRAMKAKYLQIYFSDSHIIYFKTEFN